MNTLNHISDEDLALFALQFLSGDELNGVVEHMEHCEQCRTAVGELQGDLVAYAMSAEMASPPAMARERLMRRVAKEKKMVPAEPRAAEPVLTPRSGNLFTMESQEEVAARRGGGFMAWAGWAVAAGLAVAFGLQFHQRQVAQTSLAASTVRVNQLTSDGAKAEMALEALTDAGAVQMALHTPQPKTGAPEVYKPTAHAAYDATKGSLVFVASNLAQLQAYKTYELWVLPAEDGKPAIPAGIFKPDPSGNASVVMPDIPKGVVAKGFGVTVEDDGGVKQPTMSTITLVGLGV